MPTKLPINLLDLLRQRTVESERIEYKAGWNPEAILRTVCAFANDFENLGGGYVVIGQDCDANGQPIFPPVGLADNQLDKIQRELLAHCPFDQAGRSPGRPRGEPPLPQPAHRRVSEGVGSDRRPRHRHPQNPEGDDGQWLAGAGVRERR